MFTRDEQKQSVSVRRMRLPGRYLKVNYFVLSVSTCVGMVILIIFSGLYVNEAHRYVRRYDGTKAVHAIFGIHVMLGLLAFIHSKDKA